MNSLLRLPLLFAISVFMTTSLQVIGQQFSRVGGAVSSTLSDSRSVNFVDFNQDGWEDIFVSNGLRGGQPDLLYLNDGQGNLIAVNGTPITEAMNPSVGASFADMNNDGFPDGIITSWYGAEDLFYQNDGSGGMIYKPDAGFPQSSLAESVAWGDYNGDGLLDAYIAISGAQGSRNALFKNLGNGSFESQNDHATVLDSKVSRCVTWTDVDNDGRLDLFITNEGSGFNDLFLNHGGGSFTPYQGTAIGTFSSSTMTASWGDIDNDGDMDLFLGNGSPRESNNQLYINENGSLVQRQDGVLGEFRGCTFGSAFGDYDNDGDLDLYIANGFCDSNLRNALFANDGTGNFENRSNDLVLNSAVCSYGAAWGDIDNDGFLDLMVANCKNDDQDDEKINTLLRNLGNDNHWLKVSLLGTISNRDAIGGRVSILSTINGQRVWQMREVNSQSGYAGQNSKILHFGLGDAEVIDTLIVQFPSGKKFWYKAVEANQSIEYREDVTTSIIQPQEQNDNAFLVFPNPVPSNHPIYIELSDDNTSEWNVTLSDLNGRVVVSKRYDPYSSHEASMCLLQFKEMQEGLYFLTISDHAKSWVKAIVLR